MATTESELENINSLTNEIRDAAEDLDPRKLGLGDLIQSVRDSQRNDADIRANIQRSLQNEEINANNIRGLNSLLQDSLDSQNSILQEIKTLAVSIDSMSESLSNAANNNGVGPNNQALGGVPSQGGNMSSSLSALGALLPAGAVAAAGMFSNIFGGQGTALMGDANASTISSTNQNTSYSSPSYTSGITTSGNSAAVGEIPGIGSDAEEYVKRNLGGFTTKGKRESAGMLHEGNLSLEDLITSSDPGTTMGNRINVPYTNPETGKNRFASERYHNPGAKWPSSRDDLFGGMGYNVLNDGEGNKISAFPTNIHGTAAMFSNMENAGYLGLTGRQFATRWRGRDSAVPNTISQNGGVFTREMLQNRDLMIQLAAEMQQHEGTLTPLNAQELGMGYDMYRAGGATQYFKDNPEAVNYMKQLLYMKQQSNSGQSISQIASNLQQQQVPNQLTSNLEMPQGAQMPEGASQQPAGGSTGGGPGTDAVSASPSIAEDPMSKYRQFTGTVANLSDREKQQISKLQKFAKLAGISEQSVGLMKVMNNPAELKKYIDGLAPEDREKVLGDLDKLSNDERFKPSEGMEKALGQVQGILQKPSQAQEGQGQEESEGGGGKGGVQGQPQEGLSLSGSQQGAQGAQASQGLSLSGSQQGAQGAQASQGLSLMDPKEAQEAQASKEEDVFSRLDRYRAENDLAKLVTGDEDADIIDYYRSSLSRRNGKIDALEQEVLNKKQNQIYDVNNDDNDKVDPQTQADAQLLSDWDRLSEKGAELPVIRGPQPLDSDHQTKVQSLSDQIDNLSKDRLDAAKALYGPQLYDQHGNTTEAYFAAINKQVKDAQKQTRTIQDEATKNAIDDNNDSSGADTDPGSSTASATKPAGDVSLKGRGESFAASLETTQGYDTTEQTSINPNAKPVSSSLV